MLQWAKGKQELEIVDMIIRIREKLVCTIAHLIAITLSTRHATPVFSQHKYSTA